MFEPIGVLLTVAVPSLLAWGLYRLEKRRAREQIEDWKRVAAAAGLIDVETEWLNILGPSTRLTGRAGALAVELSTRNHSKTELMYSLAVGGLGHRAGELTLHREDLGATIVKTLGRREVEIGDPAFDDQLYVRGSPVLAQAIFDVPTRRSVIRLFADESARVWLSDGVLHYESAGSERMPSWMERQLPLVLDVARQLSRPADVAGYLATHVGRDPLPSVRLTGLRVLAREFPNLPATLDSLRSALDDPDPRVRLLAAIELREEGEPRLLELASDGEGPEEAQAKAVSTLGLALPIADALEILSQALRSRRLFVAEACLTGLGAAGGPEVVDTLAKVLAVERGWLAAAAARALGDSGETSAERPLRAALDRPDEGVGVAAAEALGRVGTASAVASLRGVESSSGDDALRRAAREAVAQIQSRLTGATPGQLSLAAGESGQLSLTDDKAGRVALLVDDDGATPKEPGPGSQN